VLAWELDSELDSDAFAPPLARDVDHG